MGYRLSKIYTRTGDDGKTQVEPGKRISKNSLRIKSLGTLDELNCVIGLVLTQPLANPEMKTCLTEIQHDLFNLGGELCPPYYVAITPEKISHLEEMIDHWNENLPPLKEFILPRGNTATTYCHLARAICRRAEIDLVALHEEENISADCLRYINRLSDLLFVAARVLAKAEKNEEVLWAHEKKK